MGNWALALQDLSQIKVEPITRKYFCRYLTMRSDCPSLNNKLAFIVNITTSAEFVVNLMTNPTRSSLN